MSSIYVIEHPHLSDDGQLLAGSQLRLWLDGQPREPLVLEQLGSEKLQKAKFFIAMGSPEASLSTHASWPVRVQALGQALESVSGRGWKVYSAAGVMTMSYGKDLFFSISLDKGYEHALGAIELAFRQSPPSSGTVFLFEASDTGTQANTLVAFFERLGLKVRPLELGSGVAGVLRIAFKNAPKGLPLGVAVLSLLLIFSFLLPLQGARDPSFASTDLSSNKTQPSPMSVSSFERLLNPIVQAAGLAGMVEVQQLTLEPGPVINTIAISIQPVGAALGAQTDFESVRLQLARLPGVSAVNTPQGSGTSLSLQVVATDIRFSSQGRGVKPGLTAPAPTAVDSQRVRLHEIARKSAIVLGEPSLNPQLGIVFDLPEQPIASVLLFLGRLTAANADFVLTRMELQRGSQPGLVSTVIGLQP